MGILLFVLIYIVYFLASEDDKWGHVSDQQKSWTVPLRGRFWAKLNDAAEVFLWYDSKMTSNV